MTPTATRRPGVTLPELLLVAWLFALVLVATARFAGAQGRLAATSQDRVRVADAIRTVDLVLGGELRYATTRDIRTGADSVRLRALRGGGPICGGGASPEVAYRGVRQPDPDKDSVLVIAEGRVETVHALDGVTASAGCDGVRLTLSPPAAAARGLILVFETGAYHLQGGALRYRRGRGGRQPVTEAVLQNARIERGNGGLTVRATPDPDSFPRLDVREWTTAISVLDPEFSAVRDPGGEP